MILCVNANAAIDKTALVSPFRLDAIHRPQQVLALPGGKGCNVARALRTLGAEALVTGWVGGFAGQFIDAGLRQEDIRTDFVQTEGESRTCLSILDQETGTMTELYEKGAPVTSQNIDDLLTRFRQHVAGASMATLSGSLPAGAPPDLYRTLGEIAQAAGVPFVLDSSGAALRHGLEARPALVKPNQTEFAELVGSSDDIPAAARDLAQRYGTRVVVSLGPDGVLATNGAQTWRARPPQVQPVSAVGSGDCLVGGLTLALSQGEPFEEALRSGVAAGTANTLQLGAGRFTLEDYTRIRAQVTVEAL
jgi:tagatose 6-phosphate kinase